MLRRSVHPLGVRLSCFVQAVSVVLIFAAVIRGQTNIVNVYDDSGRLIAVIQPSGDVARYTYDAAGNLLSISRSSSSTVSVIHFTPTRGPVGTVVTIYGTGFSTTPSQNTVTFNGVTAAVTSSSATQIVTSVPSSATTGTIAVTSPAGSASSATSFTVTSSTAPTISSFSPTIGTTGTAISISGTNFETTAANNTTKFNATYASVSTSTSTSISTTVPAFGGSGKITVATPNGSATSANDFFIPPSPNSASDVAVTGRMISGESKTVTLSSANKIGMILFDGVAGQRPYIKVTSSSIGITTLSIYNPNGIQVNSGLFDTSGGSLDGSIFSATGTYAIVVDPAASYTGSITFTLYLSTDYSSTIATNGSGVGITTTTPGQNARLNFNATANQRVYLKITNVSMSGGTNNWVNVSINKLNGSSLATTVVDTSGGAIDTLTLPTAGTYYVYVDPTNASSGTATLTLYDVPADVTGTISANGSSLTATTTALGQNANYTFSGTANQRVYLKISSVSLSGGSPTWANVSIRKPDGTNLVSTTVSSSGQIDTTTLPSTGTYAVFVDPLNTCYGSVTLNLYDIPADDTGTITPGGASVTATTTTPGQNALRTFSGTVDQRVSLNITNASLAGNSWVTITIKKPDGSQLTSTVLDSSGGFIDVKTLPTTGTYTIFIDPYASNTGSVTLTLYDVPADANTSTTINASAVGLTTTVPGQNAYVTFSGTANQQVSVAFTSNTMGTVTATLVKPDGTSLTSSTSSASSFTFTTQTLPTTGTYTVKIDPSGTSMGSISVAASEVSSSATLKGDYQFQNTRSSSVGSPPDLADLGTNSFTTATVDGTSRTVLTFSQNNGLSLSSTSGVIPNDTYSIVVLFSFEQTSSYRRIIDFKNGSSDNGLYQSYGHLYFYPPGYGSSAPISANTYAQVVITRDSSGTVTGYVDGTQQFQFSDSSNYGVISNNTLRFFRDDGSYSEASAGSVARIRIYDGPLTATQVSALSRLP